LLSLTELTASKTSKTQSESILHSLERGRYFLLTMYPNESKSHSRGTHVASSLDDVT